MTDPIERTARYQDDLARLLAALEPVERAEVLDGVREHIDAALAEVGHAPTDADVDRILGRLGSPGMVAEAALAERPGVSAPGAAGAPMAAGHGSTARLASAGGSWREQLMGRWVPPTVVIGLFLLGILSLSRLVWLPLLALIVILAASGLWTVPEKVVCAIVPPVGLFLATIGAITGRDRVLIPGMILLPIALAILVVIGYRGGKRAKAHAQQTAGVPAS